MPYDNTGMNTETPDAVNAHLGLEKEKIEPMLSRDTSDAGVSHNESRFDEEYEETDCPFDEPEVREVVSKESMHEREIVKGVLDLSNVEHSEIKDVAPEEEAKIETDQDV
eukprot:13957516-Ditylum_brightwellii.AAC.1